MEDLGYCLAPAVEEVQPAVLDCKIAGTLLATSLAEEIQLSPVIELPDDAPLREASTVGHRGAGHILTHPGGMPTSSSSFSAGSAFSMYSISVEEGSKRSCTLLTASRLSCDLSTITIRPGGSAGVCPPIR